MPGVFRLCSRGPTEGEVSTRIGPRGIRKVVVRTKGLGPKLALQIAFLSGAGLPFHIFGRISTALLILYLRTCLEGPSDVVRFRSGALIRIACPALMVLLSRAGLKNYNFLSLLNRNPFFFLVARAIIPLLRRAAGKVFPVAGHRDLDSFLVSSDSFRGSSGTRNRFNGSEGESASRIAYRIDFASRSLAVAGAAGPAFPLRTGRGPQLDNLSRCLYNSIY